MLSVLYNRVTSCQHATQTGISDCDVEGCSPNFYGRHHELVDRYRVSIQQMSTVLYNYPQPLTLDYNYLLDLAMDAISEAGTAHICRALSFLYFSINELPMSFYLPWFCRFLLVFVSSDFVIY